jgi:metallo-beta-lactamase family protein
MHLVEACGRRVLLDCGLFRSTGEETRQRREFPFDPASIDAVVLSHAHTDHCGNLPSLVRHGYTGPIYCTPATAELTDIMLADSARVRDEEEFTAAVIGGRGAPRPDCSSPTDDARQAVTQFVPVPYGQTTKLCPGIELTFIDAGHILGSAMVSLSLAHGPRDYRLVFTGDLGRRGLPYLPDPSTLPPADLILSESTYGGRLHDDVEDMARKMGEVVRGAVGRGGKVLIPAFSLGRTQAVVHYLRKWMHLGILPSLPVYVDSPLASRVARVYERFADGLAECDGPDDPPAHYVSPDVALEASTGREPCIIVASGGMCEGGRIIAHLRHHIDDPRGVIVLVSYQSPHSLGAKLLERSPTVRFHGKKWNKWIGVVPMNGFSGHADHADLLHLLKPLADAGRRVCLVHGEPEASEALARDLRPLGFGGVQIPERGEAITLA